jgi:riboflavin kinase/FMN adenylyltransferase
MLGRPVGYYGQIIKGAHLGQKIGFPTINLKTEDECLPPLGVYAGITTLSDKTLHPCAINIGKRPTIQADSHTVQIEAHLLNFNQDLYHQFATIHPVELLRAEKKFSSIEALKEQITKDILKIESMTADSLKKFQQQNQSTI